MSKENSNPSNIGPDLGSISGSTDTVGITVIPVPLPPPPPSNTAPTDSSE
ncbi:MAG: hypothetical protein WC756_15505 [Taibaiella sp.]